MVFTLELNPKVVQMKVLPSKGNNLHGKRGTETKGRSIQQRVGEGQPGF
jgi:hypothetical protein